MRAEKFAICFVVILVLFTASTAKADPLTFSDVKAFQHTPGQTLVDLYSNPGAVLLTRTALFVPVPFLSFDIRIKGTLPVGSTNLLRFTLAQGSDTFIQELIIPPQGVPTNPINFLTIFSFSLPQVPTIQPDGTAPPNALFSLTIDIIGSNPDFMIPSGPNAGQMVDSYTFSFYVVHPIPEPATLLLLGTGLAGVAARVRKRRKGR